MAHPLGFAGLAGLVVRLVHRRLGFGWFGSLYFGLVNCFGLAAVL